MTKKLTQDEVAKYFKEHGYTLVSEYINSNTKVTIQNNKGEYYEVLFGNFKSGKRPERNKSLFVDTEYVRSKVKELGYILIGEYVNSDTDIHIKDTDGVEYYTNFYNLSKGGGTPRKISKKTVEDILRKEGYTLVSEYVNKHTPIEVEKGGTVYKVVMKSFLQGARPENYIRYTKEDINKEVSPYGYKVKHMNSGSDITLLTPSGYTWKTSIFNFRDGQRCPLEHTIGRGNSKGELIVANILKSNNIDFLHQHSVTINGNRHILDFYLPNINTIIEYDGIQHHKERQGIYTGKFKEQQLRDADKDEWANQNNINMIRIPYTEDTPSKINNYLSKYIELKEYDHNTLYYMPSIPDNGFIETVLDKGTLGSAKHYGVSSTTITDKFKLLTGNTFIEYKRKMYAEYYMNHSVTECVAKFGKGDFHKAFKSYYGMDKKSYMANHSKGYTDEEYTVAQYLTSHSIPETIKEYGYSKSTLLTWFKKVYGMTKTEYLKQQKLKGLA